MIFAARLLPYVWTKLAAAPTQTADRFFQNRADLRERNDHPVQQFALPDVSAFALCEKQPAHANQLICEQSV
jgi:hypothetical protein